VKKTKQRIQKAKLASSCVVKVSKAVVIGAKSACNELTNVIADSVAKTEWGKKLAENEDPKLKAAKDIGKASLLGILVLYEEMENAAIILVGEIADASADVAQFKYGDEFGKQAYEVADIVKDSSHVVKNVTDLGGAYMATQVISNAAVDVMSNEDEKQVNRNIRQSQNQLDPNVKNIALVVASLAEDSK